MIWQIIIFFCLGITFISSAGAQEYQSLSILHTSDLHSHFTNRQSVRNMGGYARLIHQIKKIRSPNHLLLDSGDWSEGSIFFTLDSGVESRRVLEMFNFDAMVLGNHDWLVGPNQMYESFMKADLKTPILSANLEMKDLSPEVPLRNFIKPYVIKEVNGIKIGIFGLSTFQLLYDHFFAPVRIKDPITPAMKIVSHLRSVEKCQVVIALTHLGLAQDKILAQLVPGINLILGGHDHLLMKKPVYVRGVPILHVGEWGEFLGEYKLQIHPDGRTELASHQLHQITESAPEDAFMSEWVESSKQKLEVQYGENIFSDQVVESEVDLKIPHRGYTNSLLGQWSADAIREAVGAEISVDMPNFSSAGLKRGQLHTSDFFNFYPHVFDAKTEKGWTIHTYRVSGLTLRALLTLLLRFDVPVNMSNLKIVLDKTAKDPLRSVLVGGQPLQLYRYYLVASNPGILDLFRQLKKFGIPIGPNTWANTGLEAWRVILEYLKRRSPIDPTQLDFKPRVLTAEPDLMIATEFTRFTAGRLYLKIFNTGLQSIVLPKIKLSIDTTPKDALDDQWQHSVWFTQISSAPTVPAGGSVELQLELPNSFPHSPEFYSLEVGKGLGEKRLENNSIEGSDRSLEI